MRSGQTRVRLDGGAREGALRRERASHPPQLFGGCSRAHPTVLARAIQPVPNPLTHLGGPLVSWRERRQRRALADRAHVEHGARAGRPVQPRKSRFLPIEVFSTPLHYVRWRTGMFGTGHPRSRQPVRIPRPRCVRAAARRGRRPDRAVAADPQATCQGGGGESRRTARARLIDGPLFVLGVIVGVYTRRLERSSRGYGLL